MRALLEFQHVLAQLGFAQVSVFGTEREFLHPLHVTSSIVEFFHMPYHNHRRLVLLQRVVHALQKREVVAIVRVGEPHEAPLCRRKPRVARRRKPTIHFVRNDTNARIGFGKTLRHRQAVIGRAIVHHDGFPIGEELVLQIAQSIGQVRLRVVGGQDYGEEGLACCHFARLLVLL